LLGCAHLATSPRTATLKDAYRDAFRVGTAVNEAIVSGADSASQRIVLQQFNAVTAENVLKAERVNARPGVYDLRGTDSRLGRGQRGDRQRRLLSAHD